MPGLRAGLALCALALAASSIGAGAVSADITFDRCKEDFSIGDWSTKRYGPIIVCKGGTVTLAWRGLHGVFQIPDISCPSNFTAQASERYKFLASVSQGGSFTWEVPEDSGQYWLTSQAGKDCEDGQLAEVWVVKEGDRFSPSAAAGRGVGAAAAALAAAAAAGAAALVLLIT